MSPSKRAIFIQIMALSKFNINFLRCSPFQRGYIHVTRHLLNQYMTFTHKSAPEVPKSTQTRVTCITMTTTGEGQPLFFDMYSKQSLHLETEDKC